MGESLRPLRSVRQVLQRFLELHVRSGRPGAGEVKPRESSQYDAVLLYLRDSEADFVRAIVGFELRDRKVLSSTARQPGSRSHIGLTR